MKKKAGSSFFRRCLGTVLAVLFLAVCTFGTAREASAATVYKTYYVPTKIVRKSTSSSGYTYTDTTSFTYFTGDRAGLLKSESRSSSSGMSNGKAVFSRNGKGLLTSAKLYSGSSQYGRVKTTISKGRVVRFRYYPIGSDQAEQTLAFTYKSGRVTKMTDTGYGGNGTTSYRSNGTVSKTTYKYSGTGYSSSYTLTCNTKGLPTKITGKYDNPMGTGSDSYTIKYTYDKKGNPKKITQTVKNTSDGSTTSYTETVTNKFTYKNGNITKVAQTVKRTENGVTEKVYSGTYTFTYKKVKVKKKYWDMMDGKVPYVPGYFHSLKDLIDYGQLAAAYD